VAGGLRQNGQLTVHLQRKIKDNIGISMRVKLPAVGKIPRSERGKLKQVFGFAGMSKKA